MRFRSVSRLGKNAGISALKLWADCAKQFVRNVQNCGKTDHGFCNVITYQLSNRCLCVSLWAKNKTIIMSQPPYSPDLASANFFLFPKLKTPRRGKRFATIEKIKGKSKQQLLAIPKSAFQKCLENWKKCWHQCIISEGVTLKRTRSWKIKKKVFFITPRICLCMGT